MWCLAARGSGLGSRTSRTANTMSRGNGVKGHTRSGADDESRTRGLDHGVVALCPLSYIRKLCKTNHRPVPRSSRIKLLKSVHRDRWCDPSIAGLRRCAGRLKSEMKKARILVKNPGLCVQSLEGARLHAALSRMQSVLVPIKLPTAKGWVEIATCWTGLMQGRMPCAQRPHRHGACERDQTLRGSVGSDDVRGFHGEA